MRLYVHHSATHMHSGYNCEQLCTQWVYNRNSTTKNPSDLFTIKTISVEIKVRSLISHKTGEWQPLTSVTSQVESNLCLGYFCQSRDVGFYLNGFYLGRNVGYKQWNLLWGRSWIEKKKSGLIDRKCGTHCGL